MAKRFLAVICLASGFLIVVFFRNYDGHSIPYPDLIWICGILLLLGGGWLLRAAAKDAVNKVREAVNEEVDELKANGEAIKVDLSQCEVTDRKYYEERAKYDDYTPPSVKDGTATWNVLTGSQQNIERMEVHQSVILFTANQAGSPKQYRSEVLPIDRETLMFKLFAQKETMLYVDKKDPGHYYLDLEFLSK